MPFFRTGTVFRSVGLCFASHERKRHQNETRKNCMVVRVTGFGKAVNMAFDDAFEKMDVMNHITQSTCIIVSWGPSKIDSEYIQRA